VLDTTNRALVARAQRNILTWADIFEAESELDRGTQQLAHLQSALAERYPELFKAFQTPPGPIEVAALQRLLPPDTLLLQFAIVFEECLGWAISSTGIHHTFVVEQDVRLLERDMRALVNACRHGRTYGALAERLARCLIDPFDALLGQYAHLVVIPSGAAQTIPFHLLPWRGQPLLVTHSIAYALSASAMPFMQEATITAEDSILAVGDPDHMAFPLIFSSALNPVARLPTAGVEARLVAESFQHHMLLLHEHATHTAVQAALDQHAILHFATHGVYYEDLPLFSGVLLADGKVLRIGDLLKITLKADLVVLSACESGHGERTRGEDSIGLSHALLAAGAKTVIASLWPVNDFATSLLMRAMYTHLQAGKSPAVALQQAQQYLRLLSVAEINEQRHQCLTTLGVSLSRSEQQVIDGACFVSPDDQPGPDDYQHPAGFRRFRRSTQGNSADRRTHPVQ